MNKDFYSANIEGEKFEQTAKEYFNDSSVRFKIERTFFDSIGIFRINYFDYSARCIYSKKNGNLLMSVEYTHKIQTYLKFILYWPSLIFALLMFRNLSDTTILHELFMIVSNNTIINKLINIVYSLVVFFLISFGIPSIIIRFINKLFIKKIINSEVYRMTKYIVEEIISAQKIEIGEYDKLLIDRYSSSNEVL